MPALPDQPGVLRVDLGWGISLNHDVRTTLHFKYSGTPPVAATCATIAGDIRSLVMSELRSMMDSDHSVGEVIVTDLTSPTSGQGAASGTDAGTRGGSFLPAESAVIVNYRIARRYRGGKPRSYFPFGVGADLANNSEWDASFVTEVGTKYAAFKAGVEALTVSGCVLGSQCSISQYSGFASDQNPVTLRWRNIPTPRTVAIAPDVITSVSVNPIPGSQRRRMLHSA